MSMHFRPGPPQRVIYHRASVFFCGAPTARRRVEHSRIDFGCLVRSNCIKIAPLFGFVFCKCAFAGIV